jgi:hypothetical protein
MKALKNYIAAVLIISLSVILGLHLALFWINDGQLIIGEPSEVLRIIEASLAGCILLFGIERLVNAIRIQLSEPEDMD